MEPDRDAIPDVAARQLHTESVPVPGAASQVPLGKPAGPAAPGPTGGVEPTGPSQPAPKLPTRFYGVVDVNPTRLGKDGAEIAKEVVAQLAALSQATVSVTIEIQAEVPAGVDHNVVRAVTENCRVLKFKSHGFES